MAFSVVFSFFFYFLATPILIQYIGNDNYKSLYLLLIFALLFRGILSYNMGLCKWMLRRNEFLILSLGSSFIIVILTVLLLKFTTLKSEAIGVATLCGNFLFACLSLWMIRGMLILKISFKHIIKLIKYGYPYALSAFLLLFILSTDRYVIANFTNNSDIALSSYSVAFKLSSLITILMFGFQTAWGPFALSLHKNNSANQTYNLSLKWFVAVVSLAAVAICSFSRLLIIIFATDKYESSYLLVLPILYGFMFEAIAQITYIGIDLSKKTHFYIICHLFSWGAAYCSMLFLAKYFNEEGVAFGFMILKSVYFLTTTYLGHILYREIKFQLKIPLVIVLCSFVYNYVITNIIYKTISFSYATDLGLSALFTVIFSILLWFFVIRNLLNNKSTETV